MLYEREYKYCKVRFYEDRVEKIYLPSDKLSSGTFEEEIRLHKVAADHNLAVPILSSNVSKFSYIMPRYKEITRIDSKLILKVLDLIEHLHRIGISHGDVRIQNILEDNKGNIFFIDFEYSRSLTLYSNLINKKRYIEYDYKKFFYFFYDHGYSDIAWLENYLVVNKFLDSSFFSSAELKRIQPTTNYLYYGNIRMLDERRDLGVFPKITTDILIDVLSDPNFTWIEKDVSRNEKDEIIRWIMDNIPNVDESILIYSCIITLNLNLLRILKKEYNVIFDLKHDIDIIGLYSLERNEMIEFISWLENNFGELSERNKNFIIDDLQEHGFEHYVQYI